MSHWRVLADDLTGALDTAAAFSGLRQVPVFLQPGAAAGARDPVQVVSTGTRDVPATAMADALQTSLGWFTAPGHFAFKKVDSLLRGNSLAEVVWLMRHGGFDGVIFAPAFPAQARFTRGGRHWAGDVLAVHDAINVVAEFAALGVVAKPGADIASGGLGVPDVASDADLDALAALSRSDAAQRWLWCGSAGLAWALARQWQLAPGVHVDTHNADVNADVNADANADVKAGLTHLITASRHPVIRAQLLSLKHWRADFQVLDLASDQPLTADVAQALLVERTRAFVASQNTANTRPAHLVVVGGDTLLALCQAAGAHGLHAMPSPRLGWGRARLQGGCWDGVLCYSRSGAFGAPDDLSALLAALAGSATSSLTARFHEKEPTP